MLHSAEGIVIEYVADDSHKTILTVSSMNPVRLGVEVEDAWEVEVGRHKDGVSGVAPKHNRNCESEGLSLEKDIYTFAKVFRWTSE